jgi:hypothetical protein
MDSGWQIRSFTSLIAGPSCLFFTVRIVKLTPKLRGRRLKFDTEFVWTIRIWASRPDYASWHFQARPWILDPKVAPRRPVNEGKYQSSVKVDHGRQS